MAPTRASACGRVPSRSPLLLWFTMEAREGKSVKPCFKAARGIGLPSENPDGQQDAITAGVEIEMRIRCKVLIANASSLCGGLLAAILVSSNISYPQASS